MLASDTSQVRAAEVMRHQLHARGVTLTIERLTLEEIAARGSSGNFQLLLAPVPAPDSRAFLQQFSSLPAHAPYNWTGYANPEYDAAVEAGDGALARTILARDVPVIVLFEIREFAAVDARFCGGKPTSPTSWRWLADLYPCKAGAAP